MWFTEEHKSFLNKRYWKWPVNKTKEELIHVFKLYDILFGLPIQKCFRINL